MPAQRKKAAHDSAAFVVDRIAGLSAHGVGDKHRDKTAEYIDRRGDYQKQDC